MALSENAKNYIFAVLMAITGYLYTSLVEMDAEVNSTTQALTTQQRVVRLHLVDMENRMRVLENANCGHIKPTVLQ